MWRKGWLPVLAAGGGVALLIWLGAWSPQPGGARPQGERGAGAHGSVFVRGPGGAGGDDVILLPDFEVALVNQKTGWQSPVRSTDLFGRYMFPPVEPGTYSLVWKRQRGWDEGRHPDPVVITNDTQYPRPLEVKPERGRVAVTGRVRLGDGGSPWYASDFFGVVRFAQVGPVDSDPEAVAGPVRANYAGDYAIAARAGARLRLQATAAGAKKTDAARAVALDDKPAAGYDLEVENRRPLIDAVLSRANGQPVRHVPPGASVRLAALARDPDGDGLSYSWKSDSGRLGDGGESVEWSLPDRPGAYTAYLLVSDGRGGDAQGRVTVAVGAKGDTFSGRVVDPKGRPVAKARVAVNRATGASDANGYFQVVVSPAPRYVLNVSRAGYAPLSRLFDRPSNGHVWRLVPAQVTAADPTRKIELVDRRPALADRRLKGVRLTIPANALVDAAGKLPTGMLSASVATLDLGADEAPGDWIARRDGQEVALISYGVAFVAFTDAAGKQYNLAPGKLADVTLPIPRSMVAKAPAQMPMWTYDEADGYWKFLGDAKLDSAAAAYRGKLPHFSFVNMDQPGAVSCLRVHSDSSIPTGLKLRVADVPGEGVEFATVKEVVLDGPLNAVYRIPAARR